MQFVPGIKVICTAHGESIENIKINKNLSKMLDLHLFEKIIFLKSKGKRGEIREIFEF